MTNDLVCGKVDKSRFNVMLKDCPKLVVLLASFNGDAHLRDQIESIAIQQGAQITLLVSDDGSTDQTKSIVERYTRDPRFESVMLIDGPKAGFAENFRHLILKASDHFDYFAFSDQDDEWLPSKVSNALNTLADCEDKLAAVYCGRTEVISKTGQTLGYSPLFVHPPAFRNAIVQSIAGGNTMILNRSAMRLLKSACERTDFLVHDWFCYIIVSGAGGKIIYDRQPSVRYRQHDSNLIGSNNSFASRLTRMIMLFSGTYTEWNGRNIKALEKLDDLLTLDTKEVLRLFKIARSAGFLERVRALLKAGIFRQTLFGTFSLFVACLFKKL